MKAYRLVLAVFFIAFNVVLFSCGDEECDCLPVSISLDKTSVYANVGSKVTIGITVSSTVNLKSIAASPSIAGAVSTGFQADSFLFEGNTQNFKSGKSGAYVKYDYIIPFRANEVKITFTAVDMNSSNTSVCTISVLPQADPISTRVSTLGGGASSKGSYYATSTGIVYIPSSAVNNSPAIDLIYYYETSAGFYAPDNLTIVSYYTGWASAPAKNATKFAATTITAAEFDAMSDDLGFLAVSSNASSDYITGLTVGQVIAFKTALGKLGLIKITAITGNNSGTISFVCKVQKPSIKKTNKVFRLLQVRRYVLLL